MPSGNLSSTNCRLLILTDYMVNVAGNNLEDQYMKKYIICFITILSLASMIMPTSLFSANTGKILGTVTDAETGKPLVGVNVIVVNTSLGAITDNQGKYVILDIHPGTYTVRFSYIGYEIVNKAGEYVSVDNTTWINAKLKQSVIQGAEVTVTAKRPLIDENLSGSKQVARSEKFKQQPINSVRELLNTEPGIFEGNFRGDTQVQTVFLLNNISVNSGLFSDNFTGFNLSAIQEIAVLTGGYSAEYGDARAAVINVVEKASTHGLHGSFQTRIRPAGKYHFGRNMYSRQNYDITHYNLDYWTTQSQNANSPYFGQDPQELYATWQQQSTPDPVQGNYTKRAQTEYEGTLYGGLFKHLNFLLSGRYKKGVGIYPQGISYNPEHNIQGYLNFDLSSNLKLRVGGFIGGYLNADPKGVNFDTYENSQETGWIGATTVTNPYGDNKYNPMGVIYDHYPELRKWRQGYIRLTHFITKKAYYRIVGSYLYDNMDRSDRTHVVPDSLWSRRDDTYLLVPRFRKQGYFHSWDKNRSEVYELKGDFTDQFLPNQQLKSGFGIKQYSFDVRHFMASYEGGGRWNLLNVFNGKPYEGHLYAQDLFEYPSIRLNVGVRVDFFNQNRDAPANMFDPLAMEPSTPGHYADGDSTRPLGIPGTPERMPTKLQVAVSPRIGLTHPISENSVLRFSYGHFYQRPSWSKMFGFPFVNYTDNDSTVMNPYAQQETYMEEWQGFLGNPNMSYERSVQYEIGIDYVFIHTIKLKLTGYYKDTNQEANVITGVYAKDYTATKPLMLSNGGYSDTRGIEAGIDTRMPGVVNFGGSFDIYWSSYGQVGYSRLNEPGSQFINLPKPIGTNKGAWSGFQKIKVWVSLDFPKNFGPHLMGVTPLSDVHLYTYGWWRSGDPFTYHAPGDLSTRQNNRRWFNVYELDMKVSKAIHVGPTRLEFSADIHNLLNTKIPRLLSGDNLKFFEQNPSLPLTQRLPKNSYSGEPDVWNWYTYEVPPREIYFQLKLEF